VELEQPTPSSHWGTCREAAPQTNPQKYVCKYKKLANFSKITFFMKNQKKGFGKLTLGNSEFVGTWNLVFHSADTIFTCRLYSKPMTIENDDSRVVNQLEASLIGNARVIIYDHHMFIVQATAYCNWTIILQTFSSTKSASVN
jgi:hypothetical protein